MMRPVDLGDRYTPGWLPNGGVALRVVRSGPRLYFQARLDGNALGLRVSPSDHNVFVGPPPESIPGLFDGVSLIGAPSSGPDFTGWRTVATLEDPRPSVTVGLIGTTAWPTLLDAVFCNLETMMLPLPRLGGRLPRLNLPPGRGATPPTGASRDRAAHAVHRLAPLPTRLRSGQDWSDLRAGAPRLHLPVGDLDPPSAQEWNGRLRMLLPNQIGDSEDGLTFEHTTDTDRAPKVLLKAPTGNFAFGTAVAVRRTLYTRWSGGGAYPTDIWGRTRSLKATDVVIDKDDPKRKAPPRNTYKTAFIIAAPQRSDITDAMIESVDAVRRYWDPAFGAATGGLRRSDSTI
jgi:hypothetical protein